MAEIYALVGRTLNTERHSDVKRAHDNMFNSDQPKAYNIRFAIVHAYYFPINLAM